MKFTLFTAVLFSVWMNAAAGDGHPPNCCLKVTDTKILVKNIEDYIIQEPTGTCAIRAVRFLTWKNRYICSDPDDSWAIRAINDVNCRKNKGPYKEPIMCNTSTTTMMPTTTHETPEFGEMETSTTTTQQTSVSKETPESSSSSATTCGTHGPPSSPTETTPTATTTTTPKRTKPSKLKIKILSKKSKKQPAASPIKTTHETPQPPSTIHIMTALTNSPSTEHHVFTTTTTTIATTTTTTTAKMISTTVTTITTTQTQTETSTREIKSISTTANKASSDVDGRSSYSVITVQTTADPENSRTISEVDMRITSAAQVIESTPPLTTFKEPELEVAASTEDCCLTVTENRAAIHETEETPAEDWDYIQNLNRRTTEQTDKREFITKTKALEQDRVRSAETTDTLQLSEESSPSEINHPYSNNEYKKEPVQYFCIKQP